MKEWIKPDFEVADIKRATAATFNAENARSGMGVPQEDLGTCHNPYWEGNGLTQEEAKENNPYWGGSWGN